MPGVNTNWRKINRNGLTHVPSPQWYGLIVTALFALDLAIPFGYVFLDWQWQQDQGRRNVWAFIIGSIVAATVLRYWRNDPRRRFTAADNPINPVDA